MAINQTPKRQLLVRNMVGQETALYDALDALNQLQAEFLQAGTLVDADLDGINGIQQCTAYTVGLFLSTVIPALQTWMTTALPNGGPIPRDIFLQLRA